MPDWAEQERETRPREGCRREGDSPGLVELHRGGFVLKLNRSQVGTGLYAIEIISSSHLLSNDSAKQIPSFLFY